MALLSRIGLWARTGKKMHVFAAGAMLVGCSVLSVRGAAPDGVTEGMATGESLEGVTATVTPAGAETQAGTGEPIASLTLADLSTPTVATSVSIRCLELEDGWPAEWGVEGVIVLAGRGSLDAFLLDTSEGEGERLPRRESEILSGFAVSPDRRQLAYNAENPEPGENSLVIVSAAYAQPEQIPWESSWRGLVDWLDNKHLLVGKKGDLLDSLIVLDPSNLDEQELHPDYPGIWSVTPHPLWESYSLSSTVYDPGLTRVVYPTGYGPSDTSASVVLWNLQSSREVTRLVGTIPFGMTPMWSPDGREFLISNSLTTERPEGELFGRDQELFGVDKDGAIDRLTYLLNIYAKVNIGYYRWSPDGRYVAFWMDTEPDLNPEPYSDPGPGPVQRLALVDTATNEVTNYCIQGDLYSGLAAAPIWSPDGRWLAVENRTGPKTSLVYLVDLSRGLAAMIAKDVIPVGWMVAP